MTDPGFAFLTPRAGAPWIAPPRETSLIATRRIPIEMAYLAIVTVDEPVNAGTLYFSAFRSAQVYLDGLRVHDEPRNAREWKRNRLVPMPGVLNPGRHTLEIRCYNGMGPPVLSAHWPAVGLRSGVDWYWLDTTRTAYPVELASYVEPAAVALEFPTVTESWRRVFPIVLAAALVGLVISLSTGTARVKGIVAVLTPSRLRWILLFVTLGVGTNNLLRHAPTVGADIADHIFYVRYVADHLRLPLADDGLQTFQAPLFYVVAAIFLRAVEVFGLEGAAADQTLRVIPLLCAAGLVHVSYGFLVRAFPGSPALQRLGLVLAATSPMLLYKAPVVNNEMPAALLSAWASLRMLDLILPSGNRATRCFAVTGVLWGLAVLTKVSALVLAAPFLLSLMWLFYVSPRPAKSLIAKTTAFVLAFAAVCGWYFVRNYWHFGKMVIGGWDPLIGVEWWQFPGFRTPDAYLQFGQALHRPVFSMVHGVWDGLYAGFWFDAEHGGVVTRGGGPEWNYSFAIAALPWAIPLTATFLIGLARPFWPVRNDATVTTVAPATARLFCALVTGAYLASILGHTLALPFYNAIKSTYALSAIPAIVVLLVAGVAPLLRSRAGTIVVNVWLAVWLLLVGVGYWASSAP